MGWHGGSKLKATDRACASLAFAVVDIDAVVRFACGPRSGAHRSGR